MKTECWYCEHRCHIPEDDSGACGVVVNRGGKLALKTYGRPVAVNVDPIEKKNIFHFRPGTRTLSLATVGCNMACTYCTNWQISQEDETSDEPWRDPASLVNEAVAKNCEGVCFTYTEPTVFLPYALDIMKLAKERGLYTVWNTNGYMTPETIKEIAPYLDAANVDYKGFTKEFYLSVCRATPGPVVANIRRLRDAGVWVEVSSVFIEDQNHDHAPAMARQLVDIDPEIPWHVNAVRPMYQMIQIQRTPEKVLREIYRIAKETGLQYVYAEDVAENTECHSCGTKLVERRGFHADQKLVSSCLSCATPIPGTGLIPASI